MSNTIPAEATPPKSLLQKISSFLLPVTAVPAVVFVITQYQESTRVDAIQEDVRTLQNRVDTCACGREAEALSSSEDDITELTAQVRVLQEKTSDLRDILSEIRKKVEERPVCADGP